MGVGTGAGMGVGGEGRGVRQRAWGRALHDDHANPSCRLTRAVRAGRAPCGRAERPASRLLLTTPRPLPPPPHPTPPPTFFPKSNSGRAPSADCTLMVLHM